MKDLVVAYAGADERPAALVIGKLEKLGYRVTRQTATRRPKTVPGRRARLAASPPVLVLWSQHYASAGARPRAALATLRLDAAAPPPSLKAPAIDLRQWRGREDHRGWRKLISALGTKPAAPKKIAAAAPMIAAASVDQASSESTASPAAAIIFAVLLLGGAAAALYFLF